MYTDRFGGRSWGGLPYIYIYNVYKRTLIYAYMHTGLHTYIHAYIHTYVHTYASFRVQGQSFMCPLVRGFSGFEGGSVVSIRSGFCGVGLGLHGPPLRGFSRFYKAFGVWGFLLVV